MRKIEILVQIGPAVEVPLGRLGGAKMHQKTIFCAARSFKTARGAKNGFLVHFGPSQASQGYLHRRADLDQNFNFSQFSCLPRAALSLKNWVHCLLYLMECIGCGFGLGTQF